MEENPLRFGLDLQDEPDPFTIVIFGATGNLTRHRLIPALWSLFSRKFISDFRVIGFARRPWTDEVFRNTAAEHLAPAPFGGDDRKAEFLSRLEYLAASFDDPAGYDKLAERLAGGQPVVFYLSTPPESYPVIVKLLGDKGLARGRRRIIVEKPFGRDLDSARELNATLLGRFAEPQIYRIDHYLGKETVQNLMVLRFGNSTFEPVWNSRYVHHVEITMAETVGVEGRGNYYERAGAIRDILQNHLLQLLSLVAMEPPSSLEPEAVRNEKVKVLKSIRAPGPAASGVPSLDGVPSSDGVFLRGQYASGTVGGEAVPGYCEEPGVAADSPVETYAAVRLFLDTWRWSGVPFFLRAGKRLARRLTEIAVHFKRPPLDLFGVFRSRPQPNVLVWRIQPDEGMRFTFNSKIPGFLPRLTPVQMRFSYGGAFGETSPDAYERLLLDVIHGDPSLFTRNDEIEASWSYTTRLLRAAEASAPGTLRLYPAGTAGPAEAALLLAPYGVTWRRL
ncbi:MAG: glucose-6-phosphate dehydrogenase [Spirochaetales bacterium]|nr:glucose-6-phosphate dehydrogenase [Spirochaetales bacterium]